jgi:hypothetical protein
MLYNNAQMRRAQRAPDAIEVLVQEVGKGRRTGSAVALHNPRRANAQAGVKFNSERARPAI